jgi:hypothetical protein
LIAHGAACVYGEIQLNCRLWKYTFAYGSIACSNSTENDYEGLVEEVEEKFPNTKIIPYPYKLVDEQETLSLLDDVLNTWGRYVASPKVILSKADHTIDLMSG